MPPSALLLLAASGTLALIAGCASTTASREPAGPDRVQRPMWWSLPESGQPARQVPGRVESGGYRILSLDRSQLAAVLARAPRKQPGDTTPSDVVVELPSPSGGTASFRIEEASFVEPGVAERCPGAKTYVGRGFDGSTYARLWWSDSGLDAMISGAWGVVYVRPYSRGEADLYIAYSAGAWRPEPAEVADAASAARRGMRPHVLAQVVELGGFTDHPRAYGVRILDDGRVEQLEGSEWTEFARLGEAKLRRFKSVTDVMTAKSRLVTQDSGLADAPSIDFSVRNKEGEVVLVGRKGGQNAVLMQGGASAIVAVMDGFRTLSRISY